MTKYQRPYYCLTLILNIEFVPPCRFIGNIVIGYYWNKLVIFVLSNSG